MRVYYEPEEFFTIEDSVEDIKEKLTTMPEEGSPDFEVWHDKSALDLGLGFTKHGFSICSCCGFNMDGSIESEAEAIHKCLIHKIGGGGIKL